MNYRFFIIGGTFLFVFNELFVSDAFAYLDPTIGMTIMQVIIGALVGAGIVLKVYWIKIKLVLFERKSKND